MAGGPGVLQKPKTLAVRIARNGRLPATLPEPIKRARRLTARFAGEGNVVERSERYASEAKPESPTRISSLERGQAC